MTALRPPVINTLEDLPLHPPQRIRPGVMAQRWHDLAFISWAYEVEPVQRLLPPGMEVDTFDGAAWVSLVPFHLSIRLPGTPAGPGCPGSPRSTSAPTCADLTGGVGSGS